MKKFDRQAATDALNALAETDPDLSASIRKMMSSSTTSSRSMPRPSAPSCARSTSTRCRGDEGLLSEVQGDVLKNITKRAAEGLQENLKMMANVRRKEVEAARSQVMEQSSISSVAATFPSRGRKPMPLDIVLPISIKRIENAPVSARNLTRARTRPVMPRATRKASCAPKGSQARTAKAVGPHPGARPEFRKMHAEYETLVGEHCPI